jgi:hypothetical protein
MRRTVHSLSATDSSAHDKREIMNYSTIDSSPMLQVHESKNVELIAYHALGKRPNFKMAMQVVDGRWYLYTGHFWHTGWTVVDVTDPYRPEIVKYWEGPKVNTWTLQVQVAEGKLITALEKIGTWLDPARAAMWGFDASQPWQEGVLIWDVKDPVDPRLLGHFHTGGFGTHRNFYDGGRYIHLAANMEGYRTNMYVAVDISDPANPREVSRWAVKGQRRDETPEGQLGSLHGPPYIEGDRAWLPYGRAGAVLLDISNISKPELISQFSIGDFGSLMGCHTFMPLPDRKMAVLTTEAILEDNRDSANLVALMDMSDETMPRAMSILPTPIPSEQAVYGSYAQRGGKFGPHNIHMPHHQPCLAKVGNLLHLTYFAGGLRIYDIRDPYQPREVGYFVPADPQERLSRPYLPTNLVPQYEDILIDARGFIYVGDRNYGLTVLRYTGPDLG